VDARYFKNPKRGMALTALAGPVSNFVLALFMAGISKVIYLYCPYTPMMQGVFDFCLYTVMPLSVGLGLFNLIPIPPLDGSKVAAVLLPDRIYIPLMRYERFGILLLLLLSWWGVMDGFVGNAIVGIYRALFNLFY
jgi:Zn-dependent protease